MVFEKKGAPGGAPGVIAETRTPWFFTHGGGTQGGTWTRSAWFFTAFLECGHPSMDGFMTQR